MPEGPRPGPLARVPPNNLRAEESVLGAMLLSREAIAEVVEVLEPDHFYKPAHGHLYEAILSLYSSGEPVDAVTVADELKRAGMLDEIGGPAVLLDFQATTPAISNAHYYAKIVEEHALLRRLITVSNDIAEIAYSVPDDVEQAVDDAESKIFEVAQRRVTNSTYPIAELLPANLDRIEMLYDRGEAITGMSTGYLDLDEKLAGLQPNALYVIGARPAMGKALALDTPIPTPDGWTTMGDLQVGDKVLDERLVSCAVTWKSPVFTGHRCFDVIFDDGSVITADAEHQWFTCAPGEPEGRVRLTTDLAPSHRITRACELGQPPAGWHTIIDVRPVASVPTQCITVDSPNHLYLAGREMIPTHNTAFALGMACNSAMKDQKPVLIFTLEMSSLELSQRLLCSEALVDSGRVKTGRLEEGEWNRISHAVGRLAEAPIFIDDNPHTSIMDIRAKARRLKSRQGDLGMIVIDYIQLMSGRSNAESRQVEVSEISRNLKILARELEAPVVALAQLNRSLEQRQDKRPMLSDLRESGCLTGSTRILRADTGQEVTIDTLMSTGELPVVWAVDDRQRLVPAQATRVFSTGVKPVFRLRLATGRQVDATANHRFLTVEGWRRLDELTTGEFLATPRAIPEPASTDGVWSHDHLGLLAHLIGDGTIGKQVKYATIDPANRDYVAATARSLFRIEAQAPVYNGTMQMWFPSPHRLTHGRYHPVRTWLEPHGLWLSRSANKFIPPAVFSHTNADLAHFLHHLWATDGSLAINRREAGAPVRCYYATGSRRLADDVQHALARLGIRTSMGSTFKDRPGGGQYAVNYHVRVFGADNQLSFLNQVGCHGARGDLVPEARSVLQQVRGNPNNDLVPWPIAAEVKGAMAAAGVTHRQLAAALGEQYCGSYMLGSVARPRRFSRGRLERMGQLTSSQRLVDVATSDIYWDEIVSIEPVGEEETFDLTVPGPHNFIANGIVAHNSLEQDADVVLFLYRDEVYDEASPDKGVAEVIVAKHRNGPTGKVRLAFRGQYTRFDNMARSGNRGGGSGGGPDEF